MLRIGINAVGTRHSGAATVLLQLVHGLRTWAPDVSVVVFCSPASERNFAFDAAAGIEAMDVAVSGRSIRRFVWLRSEFRNLVRRTGCDVVINMNNIAGPLDVPQILFLQQSRYFSREAEATYDRSLSALVEPPLMRAMMRSSARVVDRVVVQTTVMRDWASHWLRIPGSKIQVIRPARPEPGYGRRARATGSHGWRFLYIGNNSPYKNLVVIGAAAECSAAVTGGWEFFLTTADGAGSSPRANHLGMLSGEDLRKLVMTVDALIMPSLVETVGLPMLEAMASGLPVIAADRPYARDICGNAALYFDPRSGESLENAIELFTRDPGERQALSAAGAARIMEFPTREEHARHWMQAVCRVKAGASNHGSRPFRSPRRIDTDSG